MKLDALVPCGAPQAQLANTRDPLTGRVEQVERGNRFGTVGGFEQLIRMRSSEGPVRCNATSDQANGSSTWPDNVSSSPSQAAAKT